MLLNLQVIFFHSALSIVKGSVYMKKLEPLHWCLQAMWWRHFIPRLLNSSQSQSLPCRRAPCACYRAINPCWHQCEVQGDTDQVMRTQALLLAAWWATSTSSCMSILALNLEMKLVCLLRHLKVVRSLKERHSPESVRTGASLSGVNEAGSLQFLTTMNTRLIDRVHAQAIYYSFA